MRNPIVPIACMLFAGALIGCGSPAEHEATEVEALRLATLAEDPSDAAWHEAPAYSAELLVQDMVEPRLMEPSTSRLDVRAMTDGRELAVRLVWTDSTQNDLPGASRFSDGVAIQLPRLSTPDVPAPQMGEDSRPVDISYWRASWQAAVDGRKREINSLYPNARIDHYPFQAASLEPGSEEQQQMEDRYAPARALGNAMEWPEQAVQDLQAEGPGTLSPNEGLGSRGAGQRGEDGWEVVIVRPLPDGLGPGDRSQIAFAVWDGSHDEVGARKMRSVWIPLSIPGGEG